MTSPVKAEPVKVEAGAPAPVISVTAPASEDPGDVKNLDVRSCVVLCFFGHKVHYRFQGVLPSALAKLVATPIPGSSKMAVSIPLLGFATLRRPGRSTVVRQRLTQAYA